MSSGMSSDQIVKYEIKGQVKNFRGISLRIFPSSSNQDQMPVEKGGLTFSCGGVNYGSCDAGWFLETEGHPPVPLIGLEGTDALNRGSSGNAQYQRFHHALGAVKNGYIGIYYLRKGSSPLQLDLLEMAYNASLHEAGTYLIIQDLQEVNTLLQLITEYGRHSPQVESYLRDCLQQMHDKWYRNKFSQYDYNWQKFADKRSTILLDDCIVKYAGRMKRNFTDSSQRAGHIAVGEMYLSKYLFYGKKVCYLCPRMSEQDVVYLDQHKGVDKEWHLLRHEENVRFLTRDDLLGLPQDIWDALAIIQSAPLKNGTQAQKIYQHCIQFIQKGLRDGTIQIRPDPCNS